MTKKEAVEILRHADTDSEVDADDYLKAFDMAVSALESESNREDFWKEDEKMPVHCGILVNRWEQGKITEEEVRKHIRKPSKDYTCHEGCCK